MYYDNTPQLLPVRKKRKKENLELCHRRSSSRNVNSLHFKTCGPGLGENRRLVTDEPAVSLRNNQLKFETSGELPIILEEFIEYTSNE